MAEDIFKTPKQLYWAYNSGFQGVYCDPEEIARLLSELPQPYFSQAGIRLRGTGKGQLSTPYKSVFRLSPVKPYLERQTTGDCFSQSTLVRMADGSQKQIVDIKIDDHVISGIGNKQCVTNIFKKPYNKKMVKMTTHGYGKSVTATPDHRFLVKSDDPNYDVEWKPIVTLTEDDQVLLSAIHHEENNIQFDMADFCETEYVDEHTDYKKLRLEPVGMGEIRAKNGRNAKWKQELFDSLGYNTINRHIEMSEKLAWLVGLYAASEGGIDGILRNERITYNLGSHEVVIAEQVKQYFKEIFNVNAKIYQVPSKPTVIYVRVYNIMIAKLFKYLCFGNTYTNISKEWFIAPKTVRLQLLKGWFDGDGTKKGDWAITVSTELINSMMDIAISIGLNPVMKIREAWDNYYENQLVHHKESYSCHLDFGSQVALQQKTIEFEINNVCKYGKFVKVKDIEIVDAPEDGYVYCIEVENDHSFIANGYGISNCVSHGQRNAADVSRAVQIDVGHKMESFVTVGATEAIYGSRGHGGQGMSCAGAARFVSKDGGIILRKNYPDLGIDFTTYDASVGSRWGSRGVPDKVKEEGRKHQVGTISQVRTVEEARDALANGYGLNICSNQGFSSQRDENGFAKPQGRWGHAMAWIACDDTGSEPAFLVQNSWGKWNDGGHPEWGPIPDGSFLIHTDVAERMLRSDSSFAFSAVNGFPPVNLPDYGSDEYL